MSVACVLPTIASNFECASNPAGGEHHGFGPENMEPAALSVIPERACDAIAVLQQSYDGVLHEDIHAEVNIVILQRADHFEARSVTHMGESRIAMAAEITLQNAAISRAVENRAPRFQFSHAGRRLLGMQFGHSPTVQVLTAAHGVGEVHAP